MAETTPETGSGLDTNRGIQNAEARFREHEENRQLRTRLLQRGRTRANKGDAGETGALVSGLIGSNPQETRQILDVISSRFENANEEFGESDTEILIQKEVEQPISPNFPYIIVTIAVLKDLLDLPAFISIIGIPISWILTVFTVLILFIWVIGRMSGGWWKKRMISWLWTRLIGTAVLEIIFGFIPAATIFVLMAHYREKKIVKLFNEALEELHAAGIR